MSKNCVYSLLKKVPKGKVTTYKELAKACGLHPRVVGMLMRINQDPENIPCYKVIHSDGRVGGYSKGVEKKIELLKKDGIEIKNSRINLKKYLFKF